MKKITINDDSLQENIQNVAAATATFDEPQFKLNLKTLPQAIAMTLQPQPENLRLPLLVAELPLLGAYASDVEVKYCDGKLMHTDLMSAVEANQSGSKGACRDVIALWAGPMRSRDAVARREEERLKKKNKGRKASERAEEDPQLVIREVPITVSNATLLRRLKNAKGKTLYSFGEELDTVVKTNRAGAWSQKTDCYRYAFDRALWGQDFNSDQSESGMVQVAYNWTVCGTLGSFRRFFKQDNVENGLAGRTLPASMPDSSFAKMPKYKDFPEGTQEVVEAAVERLESLSGFIDTPRLRSAINRWCEAKRLEALAETDSAKDIFRRRSAVIGFRAGVIHHLLTGNTTESKATTDFAVLIAEYCLFNQLRLWGQQLRKALNENIMPACYEGCNTRLFDQLADEFTLGELGTLKGEGANPSTLRTIACRWKQAGWIVPLEKGKYQKVKH